MNDDFLKKHRIRPNPQFVESLYQELEQKEQRKFTMLLNNMRSTLRPALAAFTVLLALGVLSFAFSPTVRAAVQTVFTINGLEIGFDEDTGEIVTSGNTDAIIYQDENSIVFDGGDSLPMGDDLVMPEDFVVPDIDVETVPVTSLADSHPGFVLPTNLPDGYELNAEATIVNSSTVGVKWVNAAGDRINYEWGEAMAPPIGTEFVESFAIGPDGVEDITAEEFESAMAEMGEATMVESMSFDTLGFGDDGDIGVFVMVQGESNGVPYRIAATDMSLNEQILEEIAP